MPSPSSPRCATTPSGASASPCIRQSPPASFMASRSSPWRSSSRTWNTSVEPADLIGSARHGVGGPGRPVVLPDAAGVAAGGAGELARGPDVAAGELDDLAIVAADELAQVRVDEREVGELDATELV